MRESNAPSPPVSQSAAITSSRRNNLLLRARQIVECAPHVVYPLPRRVSSGGGCWPATTSRVKPVPSRGAGSAEGVERAGQRDPQSSRAKQGRPPPCDGASPLTRPLDAHTSPTLPNATTGAGPLYLATSVSPSSPPHLEWSSIKKCLWSGRALRLCLLTVTWLYRDSGVPVASCRRPGRREPRC